MELTRRDALGALAAGVAGAGCQAPRAGTPGSSVISDHERETLVAVADVVYPTAVTGLEDFVGTYLRGRTADRPDHAAGIMGAVVTLDELARSWHGERFVDLADGVRATVLREVGADTAEPVPDGSPAERIRYYLVNELLYGLYTSPAGGTLVGIENPQGHPGGLTSYQRGPTG